MKNITIFSLLFLSINVTAQKDSSILKNIDTLSSKIGKLEIAQEKSINIVSIAHESIANMLTGGGLVLTLLGIIVTIYITWMQDKTVKNLQATRDILSEVKKHKKEILQIQAHINDNPSKLYKQLKGEEIENTILLMKNKHETIHYAYSKFQTENIPQAYFKDLKDIFKELFDENKELSMGTESGLIFSLCLENFPVKCINDQYIKSIFIEHFKKIHENIGEKMLIKYAKELLKITSEENLDEHEELIRVFCENIALFSRKNEIEELCKKSGK